MPAAPAPTATNFLGRFLESIFDYEGTIEHMYVLLCRGRKCETLINKVNAFSLKGYFCIA